MKQLLTVLVLAGLAVACGDDSDSTPSPGKADSGVDAGGTIKTDSGVVVKVLTPGAACTANSDCSGPSATCDSKTAVGQSFPAGYCSASCLSAAECGPTGDCPLGDVIGALGAGNPQLMGQTTGSCYAKCTPGTAGTCRTGYACINLQTALGLPTSSSAAIPALGRPVCLPVPAAVDGGVARDAGTVTNPTGMDSGL
ncbi:MAG: hypothetical protein JWN48_92 [Myxococcaceae bacterium]|nr:hypothetical protein [Myxococcaceae bacterium]